MRVLAASSPYAFDGRRPCERGGYRLPARSYRWPALAALALLLAVPPALAALPRAPGAISIIDFAFVDSQTGKSLTVAPAGVVTFSFDVGCHTVSTPDGSLTSGRHCEGAVYAPTLSPGVYRYFCAFHQQMTGTLLVTP